MNEVISEAKTSLLLLPPPGLRKRSVPRKAGELNELGAKMSALGGAGPIR